jgi:hypothetical protein
MFEISDDVIDDVNWDEIVDIKFMGVQDTIDINVDNDRLFWANDILTHNSSVNEMEMDHSHISGGISKIQTADNVIAILATPAMRERGQYQFQFLKTRSSSGVGSKVIMGFDVDTLRIFDMEEDNMPPVKTATDMMADLRRKNSATGAASGPDRKPDPGVQDPVKSVATLKELTSLIRR